MKSLKELLNLLGIFIIGFILPFIVIYLLGTNN
jgi:hypothetical protein